MKALEAALARYVETANRVGDDDSLEAQMAMGNAIRELTVAIEGVTGKPVDMNVVEPVYSPIDGKVIGADTNGEQWVF